MPLFVHACSCLFPIRCLGAALTVFLFGMRWNKGILTDFTAFHAVRKGVLILLVIPECIGHQVIQIPLRGKHTIQKIVAVNRSVMNAFVVGIHQMTPFICQKTVSAIIVCTLTPGQCLDAFQNLLISHGTSFLLRGTSPAEKKASVIRADVFLGHEDIKSSELRNSIGFRVSLGVFQFFGIVILLDRAQRINRIIKTVYPISIKTGIRLFPKLPVQVISKAQHKERLPIEPHGKELIDKGLTVDAGRERGILHCLAQLYHSVYRGIEKQQRMPIMENLTLAFLIVRSQALIPVMVQNVLDSVAFDPQNPDVPRHIQCAFILPDKKLEKDGKNKRYGNKLLEKHCLKTIIKLPENLFFRVGVTTSIFVFESGTPQNGQNIIGYYVEDDGLETVKNQGRQDVKDKWQDFEDYWVKAIHDGVDDRFNTRQVIDPREHLSYQMPQKPFEVFEEDFIKTLTDYEMYHRGIDPKQFNEAILSNVLYNSEVTQEDDTLNIKISV